MSVLRTLRTDIRSSTIFIIQLESLQLIILVSCDHIDGLAVLPGKAEHVECRIPACHDIMWDSTLLELKIATEAPPSWQCEGGGMNNCKRERPDLGYHIPDDCCLQLRAAHLKK